MKTILSFLLFGALSAQLTFAQRVIKIQIDHNGLHCPNLGPKFEARFAERPEVDSIYVDKQTSTGFLYLSSGMTLTDDEIDEIIVHKVGYPIGEIKAIIRDED